MDHFQIPADKKSVQNDKKLADKICGNICNVLLNMADDADKDLNNNCKSFLSVIDSHTFAKIIFITFF